MTTIFFTPIFYNYLLWLAGEEKIVNLFKSDKLLIYLVMVKFVGHKIMVQ